MGKLKDHASGKALWAARQATFQWLRKAARADLSDAEDAASHALNVVIEAMSELEGIALATGADIGDLIASGMRTAASREHSRLRRARGKAMSLNAPMSEEDGAGEFSDHVVSSSHFDAEGYCDAQRAIRLARRLPDDKAQMLMMMVDGLTADDMARELGMTAGEVRLERAKLIRLMQDSMLSGAVA